MNWISEPNEKPKIPEPRDQCTIYFCTEDTGSGNCFYRHCYKTPDGYCYIDH